MYIKDAIEILNSKQMTIQELSKKLNVSKDLLGDVLKENHYIFNNKTKQREFIGKKEDNFNLNEKLIERKNNKKTRKNNEKSKNQPLEEEKLFSNDEISFLKELYKHNKNIGSDFNLISQHSKLPARKPEKKTNYIVSMVTYEQFERFAEKIGTPKRMSRNDLVEMALIDFMERYK
jgi:hypothetical protein